MRGLTTSLILGLAGLSNCVSLDVAASGGNRSSPIQYGLIFEDISNSGDGGLYAELINNRAFQATSFNASAVDPWVSVNGAVLAVQRGKALSKSLPYSINVAAPSAGAGKVGLSNPGYWGIDVSKQKYKGSFYVRGAYTGIIEAALKSDTNSETFAKTSVHAKSTANKWTQYYFTFTPEKAASNVNNSLVITFESEKATDGSLSFNLLSLFPPTYNNRPNGMRPDLMEALKSTAPSFLRFPGGNNLEGNGLDQDSPRWKWNETIGPLTNRPGRLGTWSYYNTDGLGLNEYLEWCQDLNMEPILAIWSGHYLNGDSISKADLGAYVQDALNELEYLTGSTKTTYGAMRAKDGYPEPWKINFVEIGNEDNLSDGLTSYQNYRFKKFYNAISKAYPDITVIASTIDVSIPAKAGGDYHLYTTPDDLVSKFSLFDNQTTSVFTLVGEYSARIPNGGVDPALYPFWVGTVAESVFNIGLERNSGKILGSTYAPILQNLNRYQWTPDLVSFTADPTSTVRSTSVSALGLLGSTLMTSTRAITGRSTRGARGLYSVAGYSKATGRHIFKAAVYNSTGGADVPVRVKFDGLASGATAKLTVLTAPDAFSSAVPGSDPVRSSEMTLGASHKGYFHFKLPNFSVAVLHAQ